MVPQLDSCPRQRLFRDCNIHGNVHMDLMFPMANRSNREIGQGESRKRSGVREDPVCAPVDYLPASGVEQAWEVDAASSHVAADLRTSFDQYRRSAGSP